jgi:hypothetical protein
MNFFSVVASYNLGEVHGRITDACNVGRPDDGGSKHRRNVFGNLYKTARRNSPEDNHLHTRCHENLECPACNNIDKEA